MSSSGARAGCAPRPARQRGQQAGVAAGRERLERPRLGLGIRSTPSAAVLSAFSASTRARRRVVAGLGERALEVAGVPRACDRAALRQQQPRAHARRAAGANRARASAGRSPAGARPRSRVAREGEQPLARASRRRRRGVSAQRLLGERDRRRRRGAAGGRAAAAAARSTAGRERRRRGARRRRARGAARAARLAGPRRRARRCSVAPLASARARAAGPRRRAAGAPRRTRSPSATQQVPASSASSTGGRAAYRLRARPRAGRRSSATASSSRRAGARQRWPRACPAGPRPRPGPAVRAASGARARQHRPTSSANSGLPSVASTIRRSSGRGRLEAEPLGQQARVAPTLSGPTSHALQAARSSACSSAVGVPGRRASRNPTGSSCSAARRTRARPPTGASSHWMSSTATRIGAVRGQHVAQAEPDRVRLRRRALRLASQQRDLERARCGAGSAARGRARRRGRSAPRTRAAPRPRSARADAHPHAALARGGDPGLPQRRLADPGPPARTRPAARARLRSCPGARVPSRARPPARLDFTIPLCQIAPESDSRVVRSTLRPTTVRGPRRPDAAALRRSHRGSRDCARGRAHPAGGPRGGRIPRTRPGSARRHRARRLGGVRERRHARLSRRSGARPADGRDLPHGRRIRRRRQRCRHRDRAPHRQPRPRHGPRVDRAARAPARDRHQRRRRRQAPMAFAATRDG